MTSGDYHKLTDGEIIDFVNYRDLKFGNTESASNQL